MDFKNMPNEFDINSNSSLDSEEDPLKKLENYSEKNSNKKFVVWTILGIVGIVLVIAIFSIGFIALKGGNEKSTALDLPEQTTTTTDSGSDDVSATVFPSGRGRSGGSLGSSDTPQENIVLMGFFKDFLFRSPSLSPGNDIYYNDGYVGIGTNNPVSLFHVDGPTTIGTITPEELAIISANPTLLVLKDIRAGGNTRLTLIRGEGAGTLSYGTDGRIGTEGLSLDVKGGESDFMISKDGDIYLKNLVSTGSGKFLCIEDTGKIYRSATACE